jgi:hypothetical protein
MYSVVLQLLTDALTGTDALPRELEMRRNNLQMPSAEAMLPSKLWLWV